MRIIRAEEGIPAGRQSAVCLGFFDGVHIGHARLVEHAVAVARPKGWAVCVHTFDRMPVQVLRPDAAVQELTPLLKKAALLGALGADIVAVSRFDEAMMHMRAEDFFHNILVDKLHARCIVAGFHHRFGFRGEAGTGELEAYCRAAGIALEVIQPVTLASGELVSSTAIRQLLQKGDVPGAEAMLGRPINTGIMEGISSEVP